jgi:hypothetical protein
VIEEKPVKVTAMVSKECSAKKKWLFLKSITVAQFTLSPKHYYRAAFVAKNNNDQGRLGREGTL